LLWLATLLCTFFVTFNIFVLFVMIHRVLTYFNLSEQEGNFIGFVELGKRSWTIWQKKLVKGRTPSTFMFEIVRKVLEELGMENDAARGLTIRDHIIAWSTPDGAKKFSPVSNRCASRNRNTDHRSDRIATRFLQGVWRIDRWPVGSTFRV